MAHSVEDHLVGAFVSDIKAMVRDTVEFIHACAGREVYECDESVDDEGLWRMVVGDRARVYVRPDKTQGSSIAEACMGDLVSPLPHHPSGLAFRLRGRVLLATRGALQDFLFLHLCLPMVHVRMLQYHLHATKNALVTMDMMPSSDGRVRFCVRNELKIALGDNLPTDTNPTRMVALEVTPDLQLAMTLGSAPLRTVKTESRFAKKNEEGGRPSIRIISSHDPLETSRPARTGLHFDPKRAQETDADPCLYLEHGFMTPETPCEDASMWHPWTQKAIGAIMDELLFEPIQ